MKIRDIFRDPNQPWMYPFTKVKKDTIEGWLISWSEEEPGYIPDPDLVNIGDLVSDTVPNAPPYWKVTGIVDKTIYLDPYGDNPFLTGVGAGGAPLTDIDYKVFTGEAEKEAIDKILQRIHEKQYADYNDISYILLGSQPFRFGPNGAEGGWYTATDWHTRGYNKGMAPEEIMSADAATLQKLGLEVPKSALAGTLDPYAWNKLVTGSKDRDERTILPGEDWDDPLTCAKFILTHPQPQIRRRNAEAFQALLQRREEFSASLQALRASVDFPEDTDSEEHAMARQKLNRLEESLRENWEDDPELAELTYEIADRLFYSQHPTFTKFPNFDAYWFTKELFINLAKNYCWIDILRKYLGTRDSTNRKYTVWGLEACGDYDALIYVIENETHAEPLAAAISGLRDLEKGNVYGDYASRKRHGEPDLDPDGIFYQTLDTNLVRLRNLIEANPNEYYFKELEKVINSALASRDFYLKHGFWSSFY